MKIREIVNTLERFALLPLRDGFDNAGLQVRLTDAETTGALLCLDVTEAMLGEAITSDCNLVMSHHPPIFKGYRSVTGKDYVERCALEAIKSDIIIYLAYINLDSAPGGVNYKIAEKIGLKGVHILGPKENCLIELIIFVPTTQTEEVRNALFTAGRGYTNDYDSCDYDIESEGTLRIQEGSKPFCGNIRELHHGAGVQIETILPEYKKREVTHALLLTHPCEEPACDLYPLHNSWAQVRTGIIRELEGAESELEFLRRIKKTFEVGCLRYNRLTGHLIQKVTLCGEAGAFLIPQAIGSGADVFITDEIEYHDYFDRETDILLAEIGYYKSEQYTEEIFYSIMRDSFPNFALQFSRANTNPVKYL